jgi:hypothetical protein
MTTQLKSMADYEKSTRDFAYFGDSGEWLVAYTSANCSDIVTRSNFIAIQRELPADSFKVETFRGPLSGVNGGWILIDPSNDEAIATVERILAELEDYPVVDDEVMSELEIEEAIESAEAACDIDSAARKDAAPFILNKSEENNRGVGYSSEYWPTESDVFFGYLAYRRDKRRREQFTLGDDGTLDTVFDCDKCGARERFNFASQADIDEAAAIGESDDDNEQAYQWFLRSCINSLIDNHECIV